VEIIELYDSLDNRSVNVQDLIYDLLETWMIREKSASKFLQKNTDICYRRTYSPRNILCIEGSEKLVSRFTDVSFYHAMLQCD